MPDTQLDLSFTQASLTHEHSATLWISLLFCVWNYTTLVWPAFSMLGDQHLNHRWAWPNSTPHIPNSPREAWLYIYSISIAEGVLRHSGFRLMVLEHSFGFTETLNSERNREIRILLSRVAMLTAIIYSVSKNSSADCKKTEYAYHFSRYPSSDGDTVAGVDPGRTNHREIGFWEDYKYTNTEVTWIWKRGRQKGPRVQFGTRQEK